MKSRAGRISFFATHGCRGARASYVGRTCTQKGYAKCKWRTLSIYYKLGADSSADLARDEQVVRASCRQDKYLNSGND
jgi:hypothetical protein